MSPALIKALEQCFIVFGNKPREVVADERRKMQKRQRDHEAKWDASPTYAIEEARKGCTRGERRQFHYPWNAAADAGESPVELSPADMEAKLERMAMNRLQPQIGSAMMKAGQYGGDIQVAFSQKLRYDNAGSYTHLTTPTI